MSLSQLRYPNLLANAQVRLAALDAERDAATLARWTHDSEFYRLLDSDPVRPKTVAQTQADTERRAGRAHAFPFAIHALPEDRLIGFTTLWVQQWANAEAFVGIGLGERAYWSKGYGSAAMQLVLRFAFHELNLERVSLETLAGNARAIRAYEKCGFVLEGAQREWELRDGHRRDIISMGLLRAEWERALAAEPA